MPCAPRPSIRSVARCGSCRGTPFAGSAPCPFRSGSPRRQAPPPSSGRRRRQSHSPRPPVPSAPPPCCAGRGVAGDRRSDPRVMTTGPSRSRSAKMCAGPGGLCSFIALLSSGRAADNERLYGLRRDCKRAVPGEETPVPIESCPNMSGVNYIRSSFLDFFAREGHESCPPRRSCRAMTRR